MPVSGKHHHFGYAMVIALGFFAMIAIGSILLSLPIATRGGVHTNYLDALFTATSAGCVTGLVTLDTFTHWSIFGQLVILVLIQIGGLGFMTVSMLFFLFFKRRIGLRERGLLKESVSIMYIGGVVRLAKKILLGTFAIESLGAVLLSIRFVPEMGLLKGVWNGIFHSVSAFCNAGFDLMGKYSQYSSLVRYETDPIVNFTIMALIVIGGIGFFVWDDVTKNGLNWRNYKLHTKIVISATIVLIIGGTIAFLCLEYNGLYKHMNFGEKIMASMFQSITPRTAGFNTTDVAQLSEGSRMMTNILMFIGGSPGSTAGGIKTTAILVMVVSFLANVKRSSSCNVFHRRINADIVQRAHVIFGLNMILICLGTFAICAAQNLSISDVSMEVTSALSTVGLSTGITRALFPFSKIILILLMYCGRVGSLSFALIFTEKKIVKPVQYPAEKVMVG